jgi:hypothetical protein
MSQRAAAVVVETLERSRAILAMVARSSRLSSDRMSEAGKTYPICAAGDGAGSPEDCGGPGAFIEHRDSRRSSMRISAPRGVQVVLIDEPRSLAEAQARQYQLGRRRRHLPRTVARGAQAELVKVDAFPAHRDLNDAVQLVQRELRRHQHAPPHHRADPDQPDLDLEGRPGARRGAAVFCRGPLLRPSLHPARLPPIPPARAGYPTLPDALQEPKRKSD